MRDVLSPSAVDRVRRLFGLRGPWVRRGLAAVCVIVALVLALRPDSAGAHPTAPVLVARHDLGPGSTLAPADVTLRRIPADLLPSGALTTVRAATGHVLGGALRAGEPITDVRLVDTGIAAGVPGSSAVPVRLADPGVADLLRPGVRVDVVTMDANQADDPSWAAGSPSGTTGALLASGAIVLTVRDADTAPGQHGRLVVLALPEQVATRVAAVSLRQPVTVTLR
ncbi:MAG TPA: SAF domain-containing protein [Pseudonocardiaceae bacterium]|nr:SAF domain-containing protein [Pseudonocardiaceae bacterium]